MTLSELANNRRRQSCTGDRLLLQCSWGCGLVVVSVSRRPSFPVDLSRSICWRSLRARLLHPNRPARREYTRHWTPVYLDFVVTDLQWALTQAGNAGARLDGEVRTHTWAALLSWLIRSDMGCV